MSKWIRFVCTVILTSSLTGCGNIAPHLEPRYGPLHPTDGTAVDFRVIARDGDGVASARLYIYEYELFVGPTGMQSAQQRTGGRWGLAREWTYTAPANAIDETHTETTGFPAGTFVTFLVEATDGRGATSQQRWSFAAGTWPFGSSPIPVWGNGAPAERIDVAFVADRDDYATGAAMLGDLEALIFDGYHTNNAVAMGRGMWQFYYSPDRGFISDYNAGAPYTLDVPSSVSGSTIIDHAAIIHTTVKRDWASGGNFGTEPVNIGTAVHESGHAAFGLADEYDGGGHFTSTDPYHNNFDTQASCESYNQAQGWPITDCELIAGSWYRPEPAALQCIMIDDGDATMPAFARSCLRRAIWYYLELATGGTP